MFEQSTAAGAAKLAVGKAALAAGAAFAGTFVPGFFPRYIKWVNLTDRSVIEWFRGVESPIAVHPDGSFTLPAGAPAGKGYWLALG